VGELVDGDADLLIAREGVVGDDAQGSKVRVTDDRTTRYAGLRHPKD